MISEFPNVFQVGGLFGNDDNTQIRTMTHNGYPKVTVPWNPKIEADSCKKQLENHTVIVAQTTAAQLLATNTIALSSVGSISWPNTYKVTIFVVFLNIFVVMRK